MRHRRARKIRRSRRGVLGIKFGSFRPLKFISKAAGAGAIAYLFLNQNHGRSSVLGVVMDQNKDWGQKGADALYNFTTSMQDPEFWALAATSIGAGVASGVVSKTLGIAV